jgi:NAD(P)-dependent dehydrogenase (short-subunit alcohol dehydrogenase family)
MGRAARAVAVVVGTGGLGLAVARRLGSGRHLVLGSRTESHLRAAVDVLRDEGYSVEHQLVDVGDRRSVSALAAAAGTAGSVRAVVHTAGVPPLSASTGDILRVDLLGCAYVIDEFLAVAEPGTALVCVSSMAGHMGQLSAAVERHLMTAPTDRLLDLELDLPSMPGQEAYILAKRANQLRVAGAAPAWGAKGARLNSVSPGLIATPMGHAELSAPYGPILRERVDSSPAGRIGTPDDVAAAVEFLTGPHSTYVTGTDLLIDGGFVAAQKATAGT